MEVVVLLLVGVVVYTYIKARTRTYHAKQVGAMRDLADGRGRPPSWAANANRRDEFWQALQALPARKGVPRAFIAKTLADKEAFRAFVQFAGALEHRNASFLEQQAAAAELMAKLWRKSGDDR